MRITIRTRHTYTVTDPALLAARAELFTRRSGGATVPLRYDISAALRTVLEHADPTELAELPEEFGLEPDAAATVLTTDAASDTRDVGWGWVDEPFPDVDSATVVAHLITPPAHAEEVLPA